MKKKIILILSMIAFSICIFAVSVSAVMIDGIDYSFKDSEATVTSANQSCELTVVNIPETVTYEGNTYTVAYIADSAFRNNSVVTEVTTPSTLKDIYNHAFRSMSSLKKVTLNASEDFKHFRDAEFWGNKALVSIDMSGCVGLTGIGDGGSYDDTFDGCTSLEKVVFPKGITYIGRHAFFNCYKLGDIENLDFTKVTYVGFKAFWGPKLTGDIVLSENTTCIGSHAFRETNITSIVLRMGEGSTQVSFDDATFYGCKQLKYVVLPDNISVLGSYTFSGCSSLEYVVLGSDVTKFSTTELFKSCDKLKAIIYPGTKDELEAITNFSSVLGSASVAPYSDFVYGTLPQTRTVYYGAVTCEKCNGLLGKEGFIFESLLDEMKIGQKCIHCGNETVTEKFDPVFENLGYSKSNINGSGAIVCGFKVDYASMAKYNEQFLESAVGTFGVYAVAKNKLSGNTIFNEDGSVCENVLTSEIKSGHTHFDIKVIGLDENGQTLDGVNHFDALLYLGAYVYVGDEVLYIGDTVSSTVDSAVSYNAITE